ncbi:hypothetical protein N8X76_00700 [Flavobacteriaceae bacterium]|nr:hypothetical protein [Flavobacteriaceae bacterium]
MFKAIKQRYYQKAITAALAQRDISRLNTKMDTLAFLYDGDLVNELSPYYNIASSLKVSETKTQFFSFVTFKKHTPSLLRNQFSQKDISFKGALTGVSVKEFVSLDTDVLIYMSNKKHLLLESVVVKSNAKFKVGFKGVDPRYFDLILAVDPANTQAISTELTKYFKILGKIQA